MEPVPDTERLVEPLTARLEPAEREPLLIRLSVVTLTVPAEREPLLVRLSVVTLTIPAERELLLVKVPVLIETESADRDPLFVSELVLTVRAPEADCVLAVLTATEEPVKVVEPAV